MIREGRRIVNHAAALLLLAGCATPRTRQAPPRSRPPAALVRADVRLGERPTPSAELVGEFRAKKAWAVVPPAALDEIQPALVEALR